ncbi:unnamed protein product [Chironomus riparius]|uniref:Uncharacterized protein n=1 Tax=Chironomus riparius TaxID=315576 RepID=A0A9N9RWP2_9DIPT|nr:unnamed protein product [Chironomus riparius]
MSMKKIPKRLFNEEFNFSSKFLRFDIGAKSVVLVVSESASKQIYFIGSSYTSKKKKITRRQCFFLGNKNLFLCGDNSTK